MGRTSKYYIFVSKSIANYKIVQTSLSLHPSRKTSSHTRTIDDANIIT